MKELTNRISQALVKEEARVEQFTNRARFILLIILTSIALLNARSLTVEANMMNLGVLVIGYAYGFIVFMLMRRSGYKPAMKYITSCLDIILVFLLLFLYTRIEIPVVALKNYVFLVVFPLIALTAFRYDRRLTLIAGGLAILLYLSLFFYLYLSNAIILTRGGYAEELFSGEVTFIGQLTKILILSGYVLLLSFLARYSRNLFAKLIMDELKLRDQKELMDWELKIASQVQNQFLPVSFPVISGLEIYGAVQQGRFVGGDYFDFIKLSDDILLIVTADVSGNGVPAALIMAEVRASTQLLASMKVSLEEFVQRLNLLVYQSTDKKNFVTLFAAEINTSARRLTYVNAGHPPPLLFSDNEILPLEKGTIPLGLYPVLPNLVKHSEDFIPGSCFVSYTDGLTEQTNLQGEQYGEERLREYACSSAGLNAQSFTRQLLDEVKTFGQGKDLEDDISIAVVKYLKQS